MSHAKRIGAVIPFHLCSHWILIVHLGTHNVVNYCTASNRGPKRNIYYCMSRHSPPAKLHVSLYLQSKPTTTSHSSEPEGVQTMGDKSYLTLLRGLILPANPQASISTLQPHPANPPTAPTPVNPTTISAVPTSINPSSIPNSVCLTFIISYFFDAHLLFMLQGAKTFWQGSLAWSTGQAGKAAPMLPLMAQAPPGADLSL